MTFNNGNFGFPEPPQGYPEHRSQKPFQSPPPTIRPPASSEPASDFGGSSNERSFFPLPEVEPFRGPVRPVSDELDVWDELPDLAEDRPKKRLTPAGWAAVVGIVLVGGLVLYFAARSAGTTTDPVGAPNAAAAPVAGEPGTIGDPVAGSAEAPRTSEPGPVVVGWTELLEGDCTADRLLDGTSVDEITVMSCAEEHTFEVFAIVSPFSEGTVFPGAETVRTTAKTECDREFDEFFGAPVGTEDYQFVTLYAESEVAWQRSGSTACLIGDLSQTSRVGSLRGAGA